MRDKERRDALERAAELGWRQLDLTKKGYLKMGCPCGEHLVWLAKTPSNPNYYREKVAHMGRTCGPDAQVDD